MMQIPRNMEVERPAEPVTFDQDAEVSTRAASEEEEGDEVQPLDRSQSQLIKSSKIQGVLERLENTKAPVDDLTRSVSELSAILGKDSDMDRSLSQQYQAVSAHSTEVDDALRRARNLGEDLLEDMLMLDKLEHLEPESRQKRKKAIGSIESLLDTVDGAKSRLSRHQKDVRASLDSTNKQLEEREQKIEKLKEERMRFEARQAAQEAAVARQRQEQERRSLSSNSGSSTASSQEAADARLRQEEEMQRTVPASSSRPARASHRNARQQPVTQPPISRAQAQAFNGQPHAEDEAEESLALPLPDPAIWRRLQLPVRFESGEDVRSYELAARVPGLLRENISLQLGDDGSTFTIRGARVPTERQEMQLRQMLLNELSRLGAPLSCLATQQQLVQAYASLAKGKFGYFEETFRLPRDVNASAMKAEYVNDVLRVTLPKVLQPSYSSARRRPDAFPGFGGFGNFGYF